MNFFRNLVCSNVQTVEWRGPIIQDFYAAGCFFYDGVHVLAGYQPTKRTPYISGIGGSREPGEDYFTNAMRETLEELFNLDIVDPLLISKIRMELQPLDILNLKGYVILIYSFKDLERITQIVYSWGLKSSLYSQRPRTVSDLIFKRSVNMKAEISHLVLLPFIKHRDTANFMDRNFLRDLRAIFNEMNNQPSP